MGRVSHGTGRFSRSELGRFGVGSFIEEDVLVFHPEQIALGRCVYIGHRAILKGDTRGELVLGDEVWVGEDCYFQAAGGITVGNGTAFGPRSMVLTSVHARTPFPLPIASGPLEFGEVEIGLGCDIGLGAIILPGVVIGDGVQVGAGAVVNRGLPAGAIAAGVPARVVGYREGSPPVPGDRL